MQNYSLQSEVASIVLVGSFNPAIFHPEWLLRHSLISEDDNKGAKVEVVHNQLSKFSLEWLFIDVMHEKLIARTNDSSYFSPMRDLISSALKILEHTPIGQMGMNLDLSYKIDEEEIWHRIGDNLVPKKYWDVLPERVGMKVVTVESPRPDDLKGYIQVKVTPIKHDFTGVHFNVNNHIELLYEEDGNEVKLNSADVLAGNWERLLKYSKEICEETLKKAMEI
jgi:hypothetical protein